MNAIREAWSWAWEKLNPAEPTVSYLVAFVGFALLVFATAILLAAP